MHCCLCVAFHVADGSEYERVKGEDREGMKTTSLLPMPTTAASAQHQSHAPLNASQLRLLDAERPRPSEAGPKDHVAAIWVRGPPLRVCVAA